jgi:preprotein translocase subunit SecE
LQVQVLSPLHDGAVGRWCRFNHPRILIMSMNRQQKRMLKKQGEVDDAGEPVRGRRQQNAAPPQDRTSPVQFLREVRGELRKVAWPSRDETVNYSIVVLFTIVLLGAFIYGLDWVFATFILDLFEN